MKFPKLKAFYLTFAFVLLLLCAANASKYSLVYILYGHDLNKCASSQDPINTLTAEQDIISHNLTDLINSSLYHIEDDKTVEQESKQAKEELELVDKAAEKPSEKPQTPPAQPPIATFEEWTKEKLSKDKKKRIDQKTDQLNPKTNESTKNSVEKESTEKAKTSESAESTEIQKGAPTDPKTAPVVVPTPVVPIVQPKRNYASRECGAKVLMSNEEAEHVKAVLNDKERDEYMRNPCEKAKNKFMIIEMCETIQPTLLEIANFELFSSGPREIQLSIAERYPTIDWHVVGRFTAEDTREMQSFNFEPNGIYAKFIKLDLLSHYGREHYCTLSTIRVSGMSMVDEYEAEAISEQVQTQPQIPPPKVEKEEQKEEAKEEKIEKKEEEKAEKEETTDKKILGTIVGTLGKLGAVFTGGHNLKNEELWQEKDSKILSTRACFSQCNTKQHNFNTTDYQCFLFGTRANLKKPQKAVPTVPKAKIQKGITKAQKTLLRAILVSKTCPTAMNRPVEPKIVDKPVEKKSTKNDSEKGPDTQLVPAETQKEKKEEKIEVKEDEKAKNEGISTGNGAGVTTNGAAGTGGAQIGGDQTVQQQFVPKNVNSLPGTASTHKESVFMKLNKRLSALELNISLSTEYLNELSRRYVAHQEEYNKQRERDQEFLKELVKNAGKQIKITYESQISDIKRELEDITRKIRSLSREYRQFDSYCNRFYSFKADPFERSLSVPERNCGQAEEKNVRMITNVKEETIENGVEVKKSLEMEETFIGTEGQWSNTEVLIFVAFIQLLTILTAVILVILYTKFYAKESFLPSKKELQKKERTQSPSVEEIRRMVQEEVRRSTPVTVPRMDERKRLKRPSRFSESEDMGNMMVGNEGNAHSQPHQTNLTPLRHRRRATIQHDVGSEEELMEMHGSTPSLQDSSLAGTSISSRRTSSDSMMENNLKASPRKEQSPPWLTVRQAKWKKNKKSNKKMS
ncbi:unnamed protein product [Bursaphelenchus okinawaensis]|uniref:SUN domain-containing protein n=1 Tax=Bursaphelenchus okinawaensis TaxID=465554 RepID=A0A811LMH4_9BILA|nr:unnamed protein product [Bursaphelenchus okinawaensis]CAG9128068.1 unnamed protein product [Bursaphelenchus okinawaensis]